MAAYLPLVYNPFSSNSRFLFHTTSLNPLIPSNKLYVVTMRLSTALSIIVTFISLTVATAIPPGITPLIPDPCHPFEYRWYVPPPLPHSPISTPTPLTEPRETACEDKYLPSASALVAITNACKAAERCRPGNQPGGTLILGRGPDRALAQIRLGQFCGNNDKGWSRDMCIGYFDKYINQKCGPQMGSYASEYHWERRGDDREYGDVLANSLVVGFSRSKCDGMLLGLGLERPSS
ncbi:hypothetical protein P154DRAFT_298404 [Amniculicola lignicola CBS 123094]|uniref:Uncharacterized protein n=1 Tax=Amniculicola lignicola CBS 123094 TaxID=1392246 RepID=A0A6A5W5D6_9PLEO|nr:hypothetical protein P154DRAFT_298404 [Amniculicola lignicola CBS 123094]